MSIALLNITGFCVAASLVAYRVFFSRGRRSQSLDDGFRDRREANLLSRERPVITGQPHCSNLPAKKRIAVRGLTKAEAKEVLDLLESRGQTGHLSYVDGEGFAVH